MCNKMKNNPSDKQELTTCTQIHRIDSLHISNSDALCIELTLNSDRYEYKISKNDRNKKKIKSRCKNITKRNELMLELNMFQ